jgi:Ribbon-helix-helix protein, copG family
MKRITVDLDEPLYERLRAEAYVKHVSMSEIVRGLLEAHLPSGEPQETGDST